MSPAGVAYSGAYANVTLLCRLDFEPDSRLRYTFIHRYVQLPYTAGQATYQLAVSIAEFGFIFCGAVQFENDFSRKPACPVQFTLLLPRHKANRKLKAYQIVTTDKLALKSMAWDATWTNSVVHYDIPGSDSTST